MKIFLYVMLLLLWIGLIFLPSVSPLDKCVTGLLLNIVGVLIAFLFAFPQPDYDEGYGIGLEDGDVIDDKGTTVKEAREINQLKKRWHKAWAILGLVYLLTGLLSQLMHQWTLNPK